MIMDSSNVGCWLQLSGCNDVLTTAQMQQLTVEAAALVFCLKLYNPEAQHAFVNSKLDEGQLLTEGPDPTHYPMLLVRTPTFSVWRKHACSVEVPEVI